MRIIDKTSRIFVVAVEISSDDAARLAEIAKMCGKITAIWCMRRMYQTGLKESKDFIDSLID